jgi:hypothetical protein
MLLEAGAFDPGTALLHDLARDAERSVRPHARESSIDLLQVPSVCAPVRRATAARIAELRNGLQ